METRISSISRLDAIETLQGGDLFVVSRPNEEARTGYQTVKLSFEDFQEHLSAYIKQTFENTIKNIAGNVYAQQNIINTIRGSLEQTINNYIHDISGDVSLVINSVNNVSGEMIQNINAEISQISGNVSSTISAQNMISAENAELIATLNSNIANVSGDVYSENGISSVISAIQARLENNIQQQINNIIGNVMSENSLSSQVYALSAIVYNEIMSTIDKVNGDVDNTNSIFSEVSGHTLSVSNIINDIDTIKKSLSYPVVEVGVNEQGQSINDIDLLNKTVNVIVLDDQQQKKFMIQDAQEFQGSHLSRDLIVYIQVEKVIENQNLILWDPRVSYVGSDDDDIFTAFEPRTAYVFYLSEIAKDTFYVSRQDLNVLSPPTYIEDAVVQNGVIA